MKTTNILLSACAALALLASCADKMDYKEYVIQDKEFVSKTFEDAGRFMTNLYKAVDYDFGNYSSGAMQASATDESEYSIQGNAIEDFYNGGWSATNAHSSVWNNNYEAIAVANHFLEEFQGLTFDELKLNDDYAAQMHRYENYQYEARFLRAYFYFTLVRQYGGVPLITKQPTAEEANSVSRATSDEVFEYIISECNDIQGKIVADYTDLGQFALSEQETGRADKLAVMALKARAALYYASPLFNPAGDKARWKNAAIYAKQLIDEANARGKKLTASYANLWAADAFSNPAITPEILFGYRYWKTANGDSMVEGYNYPVGIEGGKGGNCPTQNLVDAYDMKNGKDITDPASGYDPQNPYKDRDPRLAATVACNGDVWPTYQKAALQTYEGGANGLPMSGATTTGYYLKKLCNGAINMSSSSKYKEAHHVYLNFRLAEVYLNYAEAAFNALGSADATSSELTMSAREAVKVVRDRVGMPNIEGDGDTFKARLEKERMVELAFEGHRFWDVRRWKEAPKYFTTITRMDITRAEDGTLTYNRRNVQRQWDDKMYLFPIPQTERMKNPNLEQNPGW